MPIHSVKIEEATPEQMGDYARNFLNLELDPADSGDLIRSKIEAAQPNNPVIFYQTPDTPEEQAATETVGEVPLASEEQPGRMAGTLGRDDPRATIFIPVVESLDGSGNRDVVVGVNGRAWQLMRGHDLDVPWRVVCALQNARATIVTHRMDEGHEGEVDARDAQRIAIQVMKRPSDEEIAAWHERVKDLFCA